MGMVFKSLLYLEESIRPQKSAMWPILKRNKECQFVMLNFEKQ